MREIARNQRVKRDTFTGTRTFKHTEFKSEELPLLRPAVFSETAILCSLISRQLFSLSNDTHGYNDVTRVIFCVLDVNNIPCLQL